MSCLSRLLGKRGKTTAISQWAVRDGLTNVSNWVAPRFPNSLEPCGCLNRDLTIQTVNATRCNLIVDYLPCRRAGPLRGVGCGARQLGAEMISRFVARPS